MPDTIERPRIGVRLAGPKDERALFDFLVGLWAYNNYGWGFPYSPSVVQNHIEAGTRRLPSENDSEEEKKKLIPRTDINNQMHALIGVIDGEAGSIAASVGVFLLNPMWFCPPNVVVPSEIWLHVRPEYRHYKGLDQALFDFAASKTRTMRDSMGPSYALPWPLFTGFVHMGPRFAGMRRLWRRRSRGREVGAWFKVD